MPPLAPFKHPKFIIHFGWDILPSVLCFHSYVEQACEWYHAQTESAERGLTFLIFIDAKLDVNLQNKSISSLYYVFNLKRYLQPLYKMLLKKGKKRVCVNLDWLYSNSWKERYNILVNVNWNLQEFRNLVGQTWTSCPPAFPPRHPQPSAPSTGWKWRICFPSLKCCNYFHDRKSSFAIDPRPFAEEEY